MTTVRTNKIYQSVYVTGTNEVWHIEPGLVSGYIGAHEDYDGAPDAHDERSFWAKTEGGVVDAIEEWTKENGLAEAINSADDVAGAGEPCDECGDEACQVEHNDEERYDPREP